MKRKLALFLTVCLIFTLALAGCKTVNNSTPSSDPNAGATTTPSAGEEEKKIAFITSQRLGDNGPVDMIYEGVLLAQEECGFGVHVIEAQRGEYEESMQAMIAEGYDLILAVFPELLDAVDSVAAQNPDIPFIHAIAKNIGDNIHGYAVQEQESAYVMGAFAAMMTQTKKIAFLGGVDNVDINNYLSGMREGATAVNPSVEVQVSWVGSFEDPAKAKELSLMHYNNGCDIIWSCSGKSDEGMFEAVAEMGEGYYAMANTIDHNADVPGRIIASHIEGYTSAISTALIDWYEGNYEPGLTILDVKNGYCEARLAPDDLVPIPQKIRDAVADIVTRIQSGDLVVQCMPTYEDTLALLEEEQ